MKWSSKRVANYLYCKRKGNSLRKKVWPNWAFNADANTGHGFAIFMASVGALRLRLRRRLTWALGRIN